MYLCAEQNGHERNNNEGRNGEYGEPSNPVLPVVQPHHTHKLLEKAKEPDVTESNAQFQLVWLSCLLLKPEQSGMKGHMCVLGRGGSWR